MGHPPVVATESDKDTHDGPSPAPNSLIVVGRVLRAHGVFGAMKVQSYMDPPANITSLSSFVLNDQHWSGWHSCRSTGQDHVFLATLENINTPEQLDGWQNALIYVTREALPKDPDTIYWVDWIGRPVVDCHQVPVGCVVHVHDFGAGPILELDDGRMVSQRSVVDSDASVLVLSFDQSHL